MNRTMCSLFTLLCAAGALCAVSAAQVQPAPIFYFDLSALNKADLSDPAQAHRAWDTAHLAASLQGIVNRDAPVLFVRFMPEPDDFWLEYLTQPGQWLAGRPVQKIGTLDELLAMFQDRVKGVVIYDDRVAVTSNLASTIAGVEDRVCLRNDPAAGSVCRTVMEGGYAFTRDAVRLMAEDGGPMFTGSGTIPGTDLPSTGSAKNDAYLWAKARYLDAGKCSPEFMAYYIDTFWLKRPTESGFSNATLMNHDFFIAHRAFFFDLHMWEEESPVDDPGQAPGTDVKTLRALAESMYRNAQGKIFQIGGFVPWAWKYTDHNQAGSAHGGVDSEWKYAQIISSYNGVMDADALGLSGMANASFYQHFPLRARYPQNPRPTVESLKERGLILEDGSVAPKAYFCFYMGDYDSAAWLNTHVPLWWRDPAHGDTLCTWAFNPNLDRRAPHVLDFVRTHASPNDWFMFGDSGAGYLNPSMLIAPRDSGLPDGLGAWVEHNRNYAQKYDLSIAGFVIDGHAPGMGEKGMEAYMQFTPDGFVGQKVPPQGVFRGTMPYLRMKLDLDGEPAAAGERLATMAGINAPKFMFIRTILKSPTWHQETMARARALNPQAEFVDPYAFFLLFKMHEGRKHADAAQGAPAAVSFTAPDQRDGLAPINVGDGPFAVEVVDGAPALYQPKPESTQYLYFEIADTFAAHYQGQPGRTARVIATVLDRAPGLLGIHYDAHGNSAYAPGPNVNLPGKGGWTEVAFDLPDALFAHSENGGADFRIVNFKNDLAVSRVRVEAVAGS